AEVEAFLVVGDARGELVAEREVAAPCAASARHPDRELRLALLREEAPRAGLEPRRERRIDAVADRVEEAVLATGAADRGGDGARARAARPQRRHVDHRQRAVSGVHGERGSSHRRGLASTRGVYCAGWVEAKPSLQARVGRNASHSQAAVASTSSETTPTHDGGSSERPPSWSARWTSATAAIAPAPTPQSSRRFAT